MWSSLFAVDSQRTVGRKVVVLHHVSKNSQISHGELSVWTLEVKDGFNLSYKNAKTKLDVPFKKKHIKTTHFVTTWKVQMGIIK